MNYKPAHWLQAKIVCRQATSYKDHFPQFYLMKPKKLSRSSTARTLARCYVVSERFVEVVPIGFLLGARLSRNDVISCKIMAVDDRGEGGVWLI